LGRVTLALMAVVTAGAAAAPVAGAVTISAPASAPLNSQVGVTASGTPACWTAVQYSWSAGAVNATQGAGFTFTAAPAHAVITVSVSAAPTATDGSLGCDTTPQPDTANVTVANTLPVASAIGATPNPALVGQDIAFSASGSDGDGDGTSASWNFGDKSSGSGTSTTHNYGKAGTYTVTFTTTDGHGGSASSQAVITVNNGNRAPVCRAISAGGAFPHILNFTSSCSDPDGNALTYTWDFGDGSPAVTPAGPTAGHQYATPGPFSVTVTATDGLGGFDSWSQSVSPPDGAPTAAFDASPTIVAINAPVTLNASTTTDPEGDGMAFAWDLDNNGHADNALGVTASTTFTTPGVKTIGLLVADSFGASSTTTRFVTVSTNAPPTPSFTFSPGAPQTGQTITFTSTSTSGAAPISGLAWDLDDDGQYDDASGPTAQWTFTTGGVKTVRLRASDANFPDGPGAPATFQRINVTPAPPPTDPTPNSPPAVISTSKPKLSILQPFPIVRIRGRVLGTGVDLSLLSVHAPKGAKVKVVCKGKGCPKRKILYFTVKRSAGLRIKQLERPLGKDAVIEIFVTKPGTIGKYTRFRIRQGKSPARKDACAAVGAKKSMTCPSG
jgi:PKD repeat protein